MRDWREELPRSEPRKPQHSQKENLELCNCKAAMKGKWLNGVYTCIRCSKPVYDAMGRR